MSFVLNFKNGARKLSVTFPKSSFLSLFLLMAHLNLPF